MPYIVVDLEWNQAMSSKAQIFNKLPIKLRGEIIQIGAVKLTDDLHPGEEFQIDVKPVFFRRIHYKVKKLTAELAEVENSVYRLATAVNKTQKRANALKNIIIPRYTATVKYITDSLEEKEREDFSRLKVIKAQKSARQRDEGAE